MVLSRLFGNKEEQEWKCSNPIPAFVATASAAVPPSVVSLCMFAYRLIIIAANKQQLVCVCMYDGRSKIAAV